MAATATSLQEFLRKGVEIDVRRNYPTIDQASDVIYRKINSNVLLRFLG
jgi:hypothetical protein